MALVTTTRRLLALKVLLVVELAASSEEVLSSVAPNCLLQRSSNSSRLPGVGHVELAQLGAVAVPPKPAFPDRPVSDRVDAPASIEHDPTLALRLEFHLPVTFMTIHKGPLGPLPDFLEALRTALCTAVSLPSSRLNLLSIRGPYSKPQGSLKRKGSHANMSLLAALSDVELTRETQGRHAYKPYPQLVPGDVLAYENPFELPTEAYGLQGAMPPPASGVTVDLELNPGLLTSDPTPWAFLGLLQEQLRTEDSQLLTGKFGELLETSTLMVGAGPDERAPVVSVKAKSIRHSSFSLVLAVVLTGLLVRSI